jgi:ATP-dependent DNA ligase
MYAQVKKDGIYAMLVVLESKVGIFGRTGKELKSCERLITKYESLNLVKGVYIAELCNSNCSLEILSGIVNPNRVNTLDKMQATFRDDMELYFHDCLCIDDFISGSSKMSYRLRWEMLFVVLPYTENILSLEPVADEIELRRFANKMIALGHEGAVFKQDVEWRAGAKDWHMMKIVRGVSYDLECIGFEEGTGKYTGLVANLLFRWKGGKTIKAMLGKGWTHRDAMSMFNCITRGHTGNEHGYHLFSQPMGKCFAVYALQESSKGVLRLPKTGELRHDKEPEL